jgi:hypothetical protein
MDLHESSSSLATSMLDVPEIDGLLTSGLIMQSVDGVFCRSGGFEVDCFAACRLCSRGHVGSWMSSAAPGCDCLHVIFVNDGRRRAR